MCKDLCICLISGGLYSAPETDERSIDWVEGASNASLQNTKANIPCTLTYDDDIEVTARLKILTMRE